jgi:hypothetical protein
MIDQVLYAQAALDALRFLTTLALVAGGLVVLGFAGLAISRRFAPGRVANGVRLVSKGALGLGAIGVAGLVLLLVVSRFRPTPHYEWTLDLRNQASLEPFMQNGCARWAIGSRTYLDCIYEGRITLAAQFPRNLSVSRTGRALWASGRDGRLISLHLFLEPMSADEAQSTIDALIEPWDLQRDFFDSWRAQIGTADGQRASYITPPESARAPPWLELSVRPIEPPPAGGRIWAIGLKWHWTDDF